MGGGKTMPYLELWKMHFNLELSSFHWCIIQYSLISQANSEDPDQTRGCLNWSGPLVAIRQFDIVPFPVVVLTLPQVVGKCFVVRLWPQRHTIPCREIRESFVSNSMRKYTFYHVLNWILELNMYSLFINIFYCVQWFSKWSAKNLIPLFKYVVWYGHSLSTYLKSITINDHLVHQWCSFTRQVV